MPCQCGSFGIPQTSNLQCFTSQAMAFGLQNTTTSCTMGDCLGEVSSKVAVLGWIRAGISLLMGLIAGFLSAINALSGVGIPGQIAIPREVEELQGAASEF